MKDKRARKTHHSGREEAGGIPSLHLSGDEPPLPITAGLLRGWPLPSPHSEGRGGRENHGSVLVVGGTAETPGAVMLAAMAALRAGASELRIAAGRGIQPLLASQIPEARVAGLPDTDRGSIWDGSARELGERARQMDVVLIGPGMVDLDESAILLLETLPMIDRAAVILTSGALNCLAKEEACLRSLRGRVSLAATPDELALAMGMEREAVHKAPLASARQAASTFGAAVVVKGKDALVVEPDGTAYSLRSQSAGGMAYGFGDVLAGTVAGLAARGAEPIQAAAWGVFAHAAICDRLEARNGHLGFLARELAPEIPAVIGKLTHPKKI